MQASSFLAGAGVGEPRPNAERLLMHLLGIGRAELLRDWYEPMPKRQLEAFGQAVERKAAGEPVQYIIGEQWFYGLAFQVEPAVLIPRPETELLVEAVLEAVDRLWPQASAAAGEPVPTVLDVGTGSGAIAVTLASQRPRWRLYASDLSPDALKVARTNAARHGVAGRIMFVQGDLLAPFVPKADARGALEAPAADAGRFSDAVDPAGLRIDVLVSNPPYIPAGDIPGLQPEVRDYEPRLALVGGDDGLEPYRRMAAQLPTLVQLPRIVGFELGIGQAEAVANLLREIGYWDDIRIITDYGGIDRHVIAVKSRECL
ncbi:release factor glutamine methyltransferase [Paenibacillus curdlanolyticus]|nr:release factor glutamine methyltransferase [Paenibacillus curdlanolyticus]